MKSSDLFKHDVVVVTETHLTSSVENGTLQVSDFDFHRRDRGTNGGGLVCYVRSTLTNHRRYDLERDVEVMVLELSAKRCRKTFVVATYRPPRNDKAAVQSWFVELEEILGRINREDKVNGIILVGDMNCDLRQPELGRTKRLNSVVALANMKIQRSKPTTRQATVVLSDGSTFSSSTCIDVFAATPSLHMTEPTTGYEHTSDHFSVSTTFKFMPKKPQFPRFAIGRNMLKIDESSINHDLSSINWEDDVFGNKTVDECALAFTETVISVLDKHAPKKKLPHKRRHVPWMNAKLRSAINQHMKQHAVWRRKVKMSSDDKTIEYIDLQRRSANRCLRRAMSEAERSYNEEVLAQKNMAQTWIAMKKSLHLERGSGNSMVVLPTDLNDYFASITDPPQGTTHEEPKPNSFDPEREFDQDMFSVGSVTDVEVSRIVRKMNIKKSHGHDEISARLVKMCVGSLAGPLARLMTMSVEAGVFPTEWKKANITAIWKRKGSPADKTMYRPISVLTVFAKIMEKIVADRLYRFLRDTGKLPPSQYAFRKGSSAEVALMVAVDRWSKFLDSNPAQSVTIVAVDFSRAFDTVDHNVLMRRLTELGVGYQAHCWFRSYLSGRLQRVVKSGETTPWRCVTRGVPQGGSLSPLLFVAYTAELPDQLINSHSTLFADDLTFDILGGTTAQVQDMISENMSRINHYCADMKLLINHEKTQIIQISRRGRPNVDSLTINGLSIPLQTTMKLLGVVIDAKLDWSGQADEAAKKARSVLGILVSKGRSLSVDMKQKFYDAVGQCHLNYCSNVVGGASRAVMNKLEAVDREAQRVINGRSTVWQKHLAVRSRACGTIVQEGTCVTVAAEQVGPTVHERFDEHLRRTVVKICSGADEVHPELSNMFCASSLSMKGLAHRLTVPKVRSLVGASAPSFRGARLYNQANLL
jgi:hypothetical protein